MSNLKDLLVSNGSNFILFFKIFKILCIEREREREGMGGAEREKEKEKEKEREKETENPKQALHCQHGV